MSDTTRNTEGTGKQSSHVAYHVRDRGENQKGFWTRIGVAFEHADGQGYTVLVDTVPLDGRITLRVASEKKE